MKPQIIRYLRFFGWICYIAGMICILAGFIPPEKLPLPYIAAGAVITLVGAVMIFFAVSKRGLSPKQAMTARIYSTGSLMFFAGIIGFGMVGFNPALQQMFFLLAATGILLWIIGKILAAVWKV